VAEQDVFILADRALEKVIDQIRDDQWDMEMPPEFSRNSQGPVTLRTIVNYHAFDDAWVPDILAGKTMDEAGKTKYDGDLLGDTPKASFARLVDGACRAVQELDDLGRTVHLSYGDYPAREYLQHITYFRGLRVYDIAKAIGIDPTMPADLVQGLWDELSPHADEWRAIGVFGPAVAVPGGASLQEKLLGLTGRQP
jgi:uncharacterized protein (TIGR03086 family)